MGLDKLNKLKQRTERLEKRSFYELVDYVLEASNILKSISPPKRKPWLQNVINDIYIEQQGICPLCGNVLDEDYNVDHIIPFTYGGGNERYNLQITHRICNQQKGKGVDPMDLLKYLESRYMNL